MHILMLYHHAGQQVSANMHISLHTNDTCTRENEYCVIEFQNLLLLFGWFFWS